MSARPYANKGPQVRARKRRTVTLTWNQQAIYYGGTTFRGTTYAYVIAMLNDLWAATLVAGSASANSLAGAFDNHSHAIVGENFASEGAAKEACRLHFENLMRAQLKGKKQLVRCVCKEIPVASPAFVAPASVRLGREPAPCRHARAPDEGCIRADGHVGPHAFQRGVSAVRRVEEGRRPMVDAEFVSRGLDNILAALDSKPAQPVRLGARTRRRAAK